MQILNVLPLKKECIPSLLVTIDASGAAMVAAGVCFFRLNSETKALEVLLVKQKEKWTFPGVCPDAVFSHSVCHSFTRVGRTMLLYLYIGLACRWEAQAEFGNEPCMDRG
jgi:hypothetical protein